ncbi:hypothetical protein [Ferviditalea candida]|uniref:Uncharacterized protein n=1 Tax=Ferviditalea candida TaxID=3108399 RepID=A0ABU5ZK16_9BACL|nr:hypothetical protein [Paenibacillaceae bacterium T2]
MRFVKQHSVGHRGERGSLAASVYGTGVGLSAHLSLDAVQRILSESGVAIEEIDQIHVFTYSLCSFVF